MAGIETPDDHEATTANLVLLSRSSSASVDKRKFDVYGAGCSRCGGAFLLGGALHDSFLLRSSASPLLTLSIFTSPSIWHMCQKL